MRAAASPRSSGWCAAPSPSTCRSAERRSPLMSSGDEPQPAAEGGPNGDSQAGLYYGRGIPYLPMEGYPGKLIAIEGTDGVGRSTQIQLLREWLAGQGHRVIETGGAPSPRMQPPIELARTRNTPTKLTFALLYATAFAERLQNDTLPAH